MNIKWPIWLIPARFSSLRVDHLSTFDQMRWVAMVNITWAGFLIISCVLAGYTLYEQYDQSVYTLIVMLLYIPLIVLLDNRNIRAASWTLLGTLYMNTVWPLALRLIDGVDGHLELNFILIGIFSIFLLSARESLSVTIFLAVNYLTARLLVAHFLRLPVEVGQLLNGGGIFIALIYFGHTVRNVSLQIQRSIEEQNRDLTNLNNMKDKLFSIIGHDLRSPIAGLKIQLMAVKAGYTSSDQLRERTDHLVQQVDDVYLTLDNLLQWAMLQRDRIRLQPSTLDLSDIAGAVLRLYATDIASKAITINSQLQVAMVEADEHQLNIVARNILHNAIKFTHQGGHITLTTNSRNGQALLQIQDSGIGMPESREPEADELVVQSRGTAGEKGTGLGLDICREFVQLNGGQLQIDSTPGKGTTVTIMFRNA